jgi:hypothetical protein
MAKSVNRGGHARTQRPQVMRTGKTRRDHESGAWAHHRRNKELRRLEMSGERHLWTTSVAP